MGQGIAMDTIYNYYEQQITHYIDVNLADSGEYDDAQLSDIACIALNQLPPRYYRHSIDLSFYTSREEQGKINQHIEDAIHFAEQRIAKRPRT